MTILKSGNLYYKRHPKNTYKKFKSFRRYKDQTTFKNNTDPQPKTFYEKDIDCYTSIPNRRNRTTTLPM